VPDTKKPSVPSYINEYFAFTEAGFLSPAERAKFEAAQAERMKAYSPGFVDKYGGVNLPMAPQEKAQFFVQEHDRWMGDTQTLTPEQQRLADVARRGRMLHVLGPDTTPYLKHIPHPQHNKKLYQEELAEQSKRTAERQRMIASPTKTVK
tara:strand:- start:796 stop:1245 length:450 start_codon:yes stop_codon:yes gene_type:complete